MNKLGALLFIAIAVHSLPLKAQGVSPNGASPNVARTTAAQNDVTGAIDKGAQPKVAVAPVDASRAAAGSLQGKPQISYEEAFRNWRSCAVMHLSVGNPPPNCEPLRAALRKAIGARPRDFSATDARSRS